MCSPCLLLGRSSPVVLILLSALMPLDLTGRIEAQTQTVTFSDLPTGTVLTDAVTVGNALHFGLAANVQGEIVTETEYVPEPGSHIVHVFKHQVASFGHPACAGLGCEFLHSEARGLLDTQTRSVHLRVGLRSTAPPSTPIAVRLTGVTTGGKVITAARAMRVGKVGVTGETDLAVESPATDLAEFRVTLDGDPVGPILVIRDITLDNGGVVNIPDFTLEASGQASVTAGGPPAVVPLLIHRVGPSVGVIHITVAGLPPGVSATVPDGLANATSASLTLTAAPDAPAFTGLVTLTGTPAVGFAGPAPHSARLGVGVSARYPRYNEVYQKATHNSYWIWYHHDGAAIDLRASGTRERLIDQLLHEHVRAFELDLHSDTARHFTVYHSSEGDNSTCYDLEACLQIFKRFDHLVPRHEVVTIVLEFKETLPWNEVFDANHTINDLDRIIRTSLGRRLYTPLEFLGRCPSGTTLVGCAASAGWPTIDSLRGRYIVTVIGNWGNNYWDWLHYASSNMLDRAAFPMRSILTPHSLPGFPEDSTAYWVELNSEVYKWFSGLGLYPDLPAARLAAAFRRKLKAAREASIFWQLEAEQFDGWASFDSAGGITRGNGDSEALDRKAYQIRRGYQLIMTDRPFAFPEGRDQYRWGTPPNFLPTDPSRAFYLPSELDGGPSDYSIASLTEPGNRLYLHTSHTPKPVGGARLDLLKSQLSAGAQQDDWETQPSMTREPLDNLVPPAVRGTGCLYAMSADGQNGLSVCREIVNTVPCCTSSGYVESQDGRLHIWTIRHGKATTEDSYLPHNNPKAGDRGELIGLTVIRDPANHTSRLQVKSTSVFDAEDQPVWKLEEWVTFDDLLTQQGLYGTNDVLFVGTLHNGHRIAKSNFTWVTKDPSGNDEVVDMSQCVKPGDCP